MIAVEEAVVWVCKETREVMVWPHGRGIPDEWPGHYWRDPIGAAYSAWHSMTDAQRIQLMLETAIDLAMQGFVMATVLKAFAQIPEFTALGGQSYPMCRALTSALIGQCLEANTMPFEELLEHYAP
jgi:hypothetical protein